MNFKIYNKVEDCCGCTACMTICPKEAITMKTDEKGFLYPQINEETCIKCGLCYKNCVFQNGYETHNNLKYPDVYAVKNKIFQERITSRSGGMFVVIAEWILSKNGSVYGVGYGDDFYVMHKKAVNKEEIKEFKGSKYVQSDMNNIYTQIKKDLESNKYVLFTGTPCQTAGLYSCLKNVNIDKLFVCDIICHGTPSPFIWRDYIEYIKKIYKSKVTEVNFRDKSFGWSSHIESFNLENGKKVSKGLYTNLFYKHIVLRPSCSKCKYTNTRRPSDITLADFWGIENAIPNFDDNKGVSLVLLNTEKGREIFNRLLDKLDYRKSNLKDCMQHNLESPSVFSKDTDEFWNEYITYGFEYIIKKYKISLKSKVKLTFKIVLNKIKK